ncbi:MAG TPA: serine/threonine-protein kinase [Parvibaculum sp.]|jgi:serine/threonine protein kinase
MTYTKIRELGRGSFGIVDLVKDRRGKKWARKTFAPPQIPGIDPADLRLRFEREVRYQQQIDHPNVVKIHDFDLSANPPWFVMELANCTLANELTADRTLGGDPRMPLFDILAGLQALHEKGYKHRDLSPGNVLKFDDGSGRTRYAISDFGLMSPQSGQTSTLTVTNMAGGTPLYSAPECAMNFKRATIQSDIYSVGAILHDIFGGGASRVPHSELSARGPIGPIIQKCTKKNLRRRYRNVETLREDLYEALTNNLITFSSAEEKEIVRLLQGNEALTEEQWDLVFQQIDENADRRQTNHAIFRATSIDHLEHLAVEAPDLFAALGEEFAAYMSESGFDFDYCDVIAGKAQVFYDHGELDLQARITLATLKLGTSHNRWLVERKFLKMAGPDISSPLARRIEVEIEVQGIDFEAQVSHVERSLDVSRVSLHPALRELLETS